MAMGQLINIDQAQVQVQSTKSNVYIMVTLQQDLDIDAVEARTNHMAYPMVDLNEINAAVGKNFATPDDLDPELELLKDELEDKTNVWADDVATPSHLTGVPCHRHQWLITRCQRSYVGH